MGHPNLSPELNAIVDYTSDHANTLDMSLLDPNTVVRVVFGEIRGKEIGFSFVVLQPADPKVMENQKHSEGRLLRINLPECDLEKIRVQGGGDPLPGHSISIGGGCSWNPGALLGFSMLHIESIDKDRWLLWYVDKIGVFLNRTVKAIYIDKENKEKIPEARVWDYPSPDQLKAAEEEVVPEERAREFYVRTNTSVYRIAESKDGPLAPPDIVKIGLAGNSAIAAGERIDGCKFVGITCMNVVFYNSTKRRPAEEVDREAIISWTSPIVAIFLNRDEALATLSASRPTRWDPRWFNQTKAALEGIGEQHPRFVVSEGIVLKDSV